MNAAEPIFLALLASACFGLALVITQFGLRHAVAADGVLVSIPVTAVLFWALSPFVLDFSIWQWSAAAIFALVGLFFPAAVTLLTYEANQRIGPTITGALGQHGALLRRRRRGAVPGRAPDPACNRGNARRGRGR